MTTPANNTQPGAERHRHGFTYKRIGRYWHRLDAMIEGRRMAFFGPSRDEVFRKAEQETRSTQDHLQLVACEEQCNVIEFSAARQKARARWRARG